MAYNGLINLMIFARTFGFKNLVLFYRKKWEVYELPFRLPVFGTISRRQELENIRDNILQGSIRDWGVERQIRNAEKPVIVDCGVNVGVTVRWWFYLNPQATVYGIDMIQEANDFTIDALPERFKKRYIPKTAVLASATGRNVELNFDDPLFGANNAGAASGDSEKRYVRSVTMDDCLRGHRIDTIDLLKVDIEDSAASMFQGAAETLPKVKNIILEIHSVKEEKGSISLLRQRGFRVRRSFRRHLWLDRIAEK